MGCSTDEVRALIQSFPKGFVPKPCHTGSQAFEVIVDLRDNTLEIEEGLSVTERWVMGAERMGVEGG